MINRQIHTSWIIILLSLLLLGACSKNDDLIDIGYNEEEEPNEETPAQRVFPFQFSANKTVLNIFDSAELSILDSKGASLLLGLGDLAGSYDSIVWHVKGLEGRLRIFKNEGEGMRSFILPILTLPGREGSMSIQISSSGNILPKGLLSISTQTSIYS